MALGNTTQRVLVSFIAIPVIIAASYFGGVYFFLFAAFIAVVSFYEFCRFVKNKDIYPNLWAGIIFILLLLINEFFIISIFIL